MSVPGLSDAKASLCPWMTYPAWGAMGAVLLATLLLPAATVAAIAPYPFLLSLVFLGLPHGAWDHRVVAAVTGTRLSPGHLAGVCAAYLLPVALYAGLWVAAPAPAFALFIALSLIHWGQGDVAYLRMAECTGSGRPAWLTGLVRGAAPILLPVLRFPDDFARTASGVVGLFSEANPAHWVPSPLACGVGLLLLGAFVAIYLRFTWREYSRGDRAAARSDAAEIALLYTVFAVANPVLAVGMYFCLWHGARHIGRLLLLDDASRALCAVNRVPIALLRFGWQTLPILAASLGLLALVYGWATRTAPGDPQTALSVYLALIAALTFPHFLLVCWMDTRESPVR